MVFLVHYGQSFGNPIAITRFGQMGCQMFIFASGYTCSHSFERYKRDFYKKRFRSIAYGFHTALIVVVAINVVAKSLLHHALIGGGNTGPLAVLSNILLIHGVLPFCNNNVFPGGWFIGTIVILYALHPLLISIYEKTKRKWLLTAGLTITSMVVTEIANYVMNGNFIIQNNSFIYFLFLSELPCYLFGIQLYYDEECSKKKTVVTGSIVTLTISIILFYGGYSFSFLIVQTIVGLFAFFLYLSVNGSNDYGKVGLLVLKLGRDSFYIFLTHTTVVWPIAGMMKKILEKLGINNIVLMFFLLIAPCVAMIWCLVWILKKVINVEKRMFVR